MNQFGSLKFKMPKVLMKTSFVHQFKNSSPAFDGLTQSITPHNFLPFPSPARVPFWNIHFFHISNLGQSSTRSVCVCGEVVPLTPFSLSHKRESVVVVAVWKVIISLDWGRE
jgi:hypothetical protein